MASTQRIVILGGGFGGVYAALEFEKKLARNPWVEVTLVNEENFFLFTPMLHEVAASDLDMGNIVGSIRKMLRRVKFFKCAVECVDLPRKRVVVSHGGNPRHLVLEYDHLVIALGSRTNFYNLPGLQERALTMKTLGDAVRLRNRLIENLEEADFDPQRRGRCLTVVVAGGGFAGVETAAAVNDFLREAVAFYPNLRPDQLRMILVELGPGLLPEFSGSLSDFTLRKLSERGVEIRLKTGVKGVSDEGVELSDGTRVETNTLIWTAGVAPNPLLQTLPCRKDRGFLVVDENLGVPDWPGVWAVGDCAKILDPKSGKPYPPTAQHAIREGKTVARNIDESLHHRKIRPFSYSSPGQMAAIGRRTGVAKILGFHFSGFFAWWLWRTVYLLKLPRFKKKLQVATHWTLDLLFSKDLVQYLTEPAQTVSRIEPEICELPSTEVIDKLDGKS